MKNVMNVKFSILVLGFWGVLLYVSNALSSDVSSPVAFKVKPESCIALHKGQTCFQKIHFSWVTPPLGDFCLYQVSTKKTLFCWAGLSATHFGSDFESTKSEYYQIREANGQRVVAEVKVRFASVYKQTKRSYSGWRLF